MRRGSLLKRIFATALAATLIFSNGYSTIPFIGSTVVSEVKAETSSASLILRPQVLYEGEYEVKTEKDPNGGDDIKSLDEKEEFKVINDLEEDFTNENSEIKYSAGGQNILYIDKGTCLEFDYEADPNFSYFDAFITDKDGQQLEGYKKVSSNDKSPDSEISHASLTDGDTIPSGTYMVTKQNGKFRICAQNDSYITLIYHNKDKEVLTGFILKIVVLEKTDEFEVKGQDTVVATRKAEFTVNGKGTDDFKWSVDPSVGSFSKTSTRGKAIFTAADAANGKEGYFTVTTYSGIDKSEEANKIIAIKKRGVAKSFHINVAKRVKASSVNFKISSSDENYVEETIDDSISDEDWAELQNQSNHYYEKDGKRYVKYAKYYLAKQSEYLLSDKFEYLPKDSNDIFKYTSSDSRFVTVMQNGTIKGITPGITSITVSPEDENAISDKAYIEVYTQTTKLTTKKEDGSNITSYSMRSTNDIEIDVEEDNDATERIVSNIAEKVGGSNIKYEPVVTKHDDVRQLDTEIQWLDGTKNVVLTQTLLNAEEYFNTNVKKYKFTAGEIADKKELSIEFSTNRTSGYLENSSNVSTYVSLDLYPQYEGVLSLKSANDTGELWTGESDTVSAIVDSSNVADQIAWAFSENNIDSEGKECLTIDSIDYTNNKAKISAKKKPESGMVDLIATTKSNPAKTASMTINVKQTAKSVKITGEQTKPTVNVGKTIQLTAIQEPLDSDEIIEWTSSNNNYLTVDQNGVVTGVKAGTATNPAIVTVTATTSHSKKKATISVQIVEAGRISIKKAYTVEADDIGSIDGVVNGSLPVYAVVVDKNNTMQTTAKVDWTVANEDIVSVSYKNDTHTHVELMFNKVGATTITVESGEATQTYDVTVTAPISDARFVNIGGIEDYVYLPNGKVPEINEELISLVDSRGENWVLKNGQDYVTSNSYEEGGKAGTYKYTLSQAEGGLYTGAKDVSYNIYKKSLGNGTTPDGEITIKKEDVVYNGKAQLPKLSITYKVGDEEQELVQGEDYTLSNGNTNVGTYEVTVSGVNGGNFKDSFKVSYEILPFNIEENLVDSVRFFDGKQLVDKDSIKDQTYTGSEIKPDNLVMVRVSFDKGYSWTTSNLAARNDGSGDVKYTYKNNINAGTATVTIEGTNNYTGTISTTFNIVPKNIAENGLTFANISNHEYTSYEITPDIESTYNGMTLVKGTDYELDYENNINSYIASGNKKALVNVNGKGNYTGFKQLNFQIDQVDLSDTTKVTIDEIPDQNDSGAFIRPDVTVRYGSYILVEGKDFTPFYGKDNGTDLSYNYKVGENSGVVAVIPVDKGNFKASKATTVSRKNGQEIFFNIVTKTIEHPADDIIIKRIVESGESTDLIEKDTIFVNATGGVTENTTVKFDIEAISNDGECDDPIYANVPDADKGKFTFSVETKKNTNETKAVLTITGGNRADSGEIMLMTKGGKAKPITVKIIDPATKVQLSYDTTKTNMKNHVITNISNGTTLVRERHQYQLIANLSRGTQDTVTWASSDESVATVNEDGLVDVKKQGNTLITATTNGSELFDGGVKGSVMMNVAGNVMAETVSIENPVDRIRVGRIMQLIGTAASKDGTSVTENLVWKSDDENVIKITEGKDTSVATIEAKNPGTTTIHYGSEFADGKEATIEVTVFIPTSIINVKKQDGLDAPDIGIIEGEVNSSLPVFGVVVDDETKKQQTDAKVNWTVADENIVTVGSINGYKATLEFHKVGTTTITAKSGDATETYNVTVTAPMNGVKGSAQYVSVSGVNNYTYLPNGRVPFISETAISTVDSKGDDYRLQAGNDYVTSNSYVEGGNAGLYKYTLLETAGSLYTGSKEIPYNIYKKSLGDGTIKDGEINVEVTDVVYNGKTQLPELKVTYKVGDNEQELIEGKDYSVSAGNVNVGKYSLTITAVNNGNFKDSFKVSYNILPFDLNANLEKSVRFFDGRELVESGSIQDQTYTGSEITPNQLVQVRVSFDEGDNWTGNLTYKADDSGDVNYTYSDNINAGTATVTIKGTKNYTGEISTTFKIIPKDISENGVSFANVANQEYTSKAITPDVAATYNSMKLVKDSDYTLDYDNNIDSYIVTGKDSVIHVTGKGNYTGKKNVNFRIDQVDLSDTTKVKIDDIDDQFDCGTFLRPEVSVHYGDYDLVEGTDYTTFYGKDNGTDLSYNYKTGTKAGVVAILPVNKGNFKASVATTVSKKNGQEKFFNIVTKNIKNPADSISIKRRVSDPSESTDLLKENTIFVNATGGVTENTTVEFDIEAISNSGECDDPVFVSVPDEDNNKYKCEVETLDLAKGNKAILKVTGGNQAATGGILLITKSGKNMPVTVVVNDPATKVQLSYDTSKTDIKNHVISNIANGTTTVRERHEYQLVANLSRGKNDTVTWSSSNESVATVDEDGRVNVKKQGNTIITATTNPSELFDGGVKGSVTMNVAGNVMAETVTINSTVNSIRVGKKMQLTGSAASKDGSSVTEKLVWRSDDENIIKITDGKETSNATIEALQPGTTTIHYGSEFSGGKEATLTIKVYIPTSTIKVKKQDGKDAPDIGIIEGQINTTLPVFGVVVDEDTNTQQTSAKVDWIIANEDIVTAESQNGYKASLVFHKVGKTTLTVKSGDATETYNVTVTAPINGKNSANVNYVNVTGVENYTYLPNGKVPSIEEVATSLVDSRGDEYILQQGTDYVTSNSYSEGSKVGNYKYTLSKSSNGLYTGSLDIAYSILQKSIGDGTSPDVQIKVQSEDVIFNNQNQLPKLKLTYEVGDEKQTLVQGVDYTLPQGNKNAGTYTIVIKGAGNFTGEFKLTYKIEPFNLKTNLEKAVRFFDGSKLVESDSIKAQPYTGSPVEPNQLVLVRASFDEGTNWTGNLAYKADDSGDVNYTYSNNINAGTATVTVTGTNNYTGSITTTFEISPKNISENGVAFANVANQEYTSKEVTPDVTGTFNSMTLVKDKDYVLDYNNNVDSYTVSKADAIIHVTGKGNYTGEKDVKFRIDQVDLSDNSKVTIDEIEDQYDCGTFLRPDVTAHYGDYTLVEGKDYTKFYGKDNGTDLSYNYSYGENHGVVAILPVTNGNFKATKATTISKKNGQEIFFNIVDKSISKQADDISIKRIVDGERVELINDAIYVNATGGVSENNTVSFEIESILNDGSESDDPVFVDIPDSVQNKFKCNVVTQDIRKGNKATLEVTGGNAAAQGYIMLMTKSGNASKQITVIVNDPATKVEIAYDQQKTDMTYVTKNISNNTTTVYENHDYQLLAKLTRGNTDSVTWESSNETVATVDENGRVTTLKPGNARITATTNESELYKGGTKASVTFNVIKNSMANAVTIDADEVSLEKGKTKVLTGTATALSGNVTEKLEWTTSDEDIVKIIQGQDTNKATIEAVAPGKAKVYYGSKDPEGKRGVCEVTVFVPVTNLSLDSNTKMIAAGDSFELTATLNDLATDEFIWESSSPEVVSIESNETTKQTNSQTRTLNALIPNQTVTITVKAKSNNKAVATCKVTVTNRKADNVSIDKDRITVNAGETFKLKGTATSVGGEVTEPLFWGFPSDKIECIDGTEFTAEPTFRAKQTSGTVTITYGSNDKDGKIAKCEVTIINSKLVLDKYNVTLTPKGTAKLTASFAEGSVGEFTWISSDESAVKISGMSSDKSNSQTVTIEAVGSGKSANITVMSADDASVLAVCKVTVTDIMAQSVSIDSTKVELKIGQTYDLIGTASSNLGAVTESLGWTTSNSAVAALVGDTSSYMITVKAIKAGTVTVTYGSKAAGGKTAKCTIVVTDPNAGNNGGNGNSGNNGGNNNGNQGGSESLTPGKATTVAGVTYVVNNDNTVTYAASPKASGTVKIPASVKIAGKTVNVTSVKAGAFKNNKKITAVVIGKNVKTIGDNAFSGCTKLKKVTIGANVTKIGKNAFKGCKALKSIVIPAKVTTIGNNAFSGCKNLKTVTFKTAKLKTVGKGAFKTVNANAKFKCPKAKYKKYNTLLKKSGVPKKAKLNNKTIK